MTEAQTSLHWRRWSGVVKANGWKMAKGRLCETAHASRERSPYHQAVWDMADRLAVEAHRGLIPDDFRRGTYTVAADKVSHSELTNKDFNRVLALWKLLIDPMDLEGLMEWGSPEIAERRGLIKFITDHAAGAYVEAISLRKHKTAHWEDLEIRSLRQMAMTIRERDRAKKKDGEPHTKDQNENHGHQEITRPASRAH